MSGIIFFAVLFIIYIYLWLHSNKIKHIRLFINGSIIDVKSGDLFNEKGLKVIAFNEFFDTLVDEKIISSSSLNGQFITKFINDVDALDKDIAENEHLSDRKLEINTTKKSKGKTQQYKLGSIHIHNDFLLVAFTKFDDTIAYLTMSDYVNCLMNFWKEINIVYANRSIILPILGASALTRIRDYDSMTEQEKLELLLWTFKISRVKFSLPAQMTIVIHESVIDKIDFYRLKRILCDL